MAFFVFIWSQIFFFLSGWYWQRYWQIFKSALYSFKQFFHWKQEKLWSFDKARNVLNKNKRKKYSYGQFLLDIQVIKKFKRTPKLLIFKSDFRKKGVCSKSVTKTLRRNIVLVSECIFKLLYHFESCRLLDRLFVCKRYSRSIFDQIATVAYLKKKPLELFCRKKCS